MNVNEESVFAEALDKQDPQERAAFLDRACAGNPGLRQSVESLLSAYVAGEFLEAGTTSTGRPYFVMELVRGIPITDYCDEHKLPIRQRLNLFVQVCQAVQHAHQKGVIHRDLKPSNVLVAHDDTVPLPKIIDF